MGGYGSGRQSGRPTASASKRIEIDWMIRTNKAIPGQSVRGTLSWSRGNQAAGSISYEADMRDPENSELLLSYTRGEGADPEAVKQTVRLIYTRPNFGGMRWWMICPFRHNRVGKLYLPPWGDRFAGRKAWRLGYQSQRDAPRDKPFERLFRIQRKLGCEEGWGNWITRPKGMWHRTFDRYEERFESISDECDAVMAGMMARLMRLG